MRWFTLSVLAILLWGCGSYRSSSIVASPGGASPYINQTGGAGGWVMFPISGYPQVMVAGHDAAVWMVLSNGLVGRMDMYGNFSTVQLGGSAYYTSAQDIAPNPDGNIYVVENFQSGYAIAKVTPTGLVTDYPLPSADFLQSIVSGSDGNIWMLREAPDGSYSYPAKMTTSGSYMAFAAPPDFFECIVRGPDKNVWASYTSSSAEGLVRISIVDGSQTFFPESVSPGCTVEGSDGGFWSVTGNKFGNGFVYRFDTSGGVVSYPYNTKDEVMGLHFGPNSSLYWFGGRGSRMHEFSIVTHKVGPTISVPFEAFTLGIGPDQQAWLASGGLVGVYMLHPIVATPDTISIGVGSSLPLKITEPKSTQKSFGAVSNNPTIATVSGSGRNFTVTGVAAGSTTITVSDSIGNSLDIPVTVN